MKNILWIILAVSLTAGGCRSTKGLKKIIQPADTTAVNTVNKSVADSLLLLDSTIAAFKSHRIDFKTFFAKIKVDAESNGNKQPDITAIVRIVKDSAIWISLSSTILNIEVYRVLIRPDSVILMNKQDKVVQFRSLDYLQEVTAIPFDYKTVEDLLIGNPVFYSDSIVFFQQQEKLTLLSARSALFKNLLTLDKASGMLLHSKLDDVDLNRHRTADITYGEFERKDSIDFATYRQIIATEKNNVDIKIAYKQYEFNKELSMQFNIPKNYTRK